jgi:predicted glycosyltransferase
MNLSEVHNKKILISCLNWGMGHVSRCIGLIQKLEKQGNECLVAGNEEQLEVFRTYFPHIETIIHPDYPFDFSNTTTFSSSLWKQKTKLLSFIREEKEYVLFYVKKHKIDLVISDHRYGFRTDTCTSIFLTHQFNLPLKGLSKLFDLFHKRWINKFDIIWLADDPNKKLAGKLSESNGSKKTHYIGILSRFENQPQINFVKRNNALLLLSGPGVHHDFLLQSFLTQCPEAQEKIVLGNPEAIEAIQFTNDKIVFIATKDWLVIDKYLAEAQDVYSFFGYSTLMDINYIQCNKHLFPCPNQWEQAYLNELHGNN